jgi:hypothetical protein
MDKIKKFVNEHPQWTSWIVLAVGMVAILIWSARDVGLLPGQWAALIIATILVAGLAVWIIGWEDEEMPEDDEAAPPKKATKKAAKAVEEAVSEEAAPSEDVSEDKSDEGQSAEPDPEDENDAGEGVEPEPEETAEEA